MIRTRHPVELEKQKKMDFSGDTGQYLEDFKNEDLNIKFE